jgi:hypothetical protein
VSDVGILNDPVSVFLIFLFFGSPGIPLGAIAGALLWRRHRVIGGVLGAVAGFVLWLAGWMISKGMI